MLHGLANNDNFVAPKRSEEDRRMDMQIKDVKNLIYSRRLLMVITYKTFDAVQA